MKYVILRDDDTNALTPINYLERLFRPFLDRGLPVNLATIPNVNTEALHCDGGTELFLMAKKEPTAKYLPIASNPQLVKYLKENPGYHILQHGCRHEFINNRTEFDQDSRAEMSSRLDEGKKYLLEAGFSAPTTFVAPYDRLSTVSLEEVSRRFRVLSSGWYEMKRVPRSWLPNYALKKVLNRQHWQVGNTILLTHPGCHLSYHRNYNTMLDEIKRSIESRRLTVLVSHWWEYFRNNTPDEAFISVLHETAEYLNSRKDIKVISFDQVAKQNIAYN